MQNNNTYGKLRILKQLIGDNDDCNGKGAWN